jgi:signal peptide peptidase SppA
MKVLPNAFAKLFCSPLMLHAPVRDSLESALLSHMEMPGYRAGVGDPGRTMDDWMQYTQDVRATKEQLRVDAIYKKFANVGIVKIHGVIDKMISQFEMDCYGGCDLADVDKALSLAANDPKVNILILDIHSPGGSVTGTAETAARVARIAQTKEVHAYTSTMCCSAAYYIASQADFIASAPSAIVGSIGVYMALIDQTRKLEMEGIKVELIKAGRLKAMGASFKPITDEERGILQANTDRIHEEFKAAVNSKRPKVSTETMQGQWFDGSSGAQNHLVDEATNLSIDEYASRLLLR